MSLPKRKKSFRMKNLRRREKKITATVKWKRQRFVSARWVETKITSFYINLVLAKTMYSHFRNLLFIFLQNTNREEEISELEASLEKLRAERMRRSAEKHGAGPSGVGFG